MSHQNRIIPRSHQFAQIAGLFVFVCVFFSSSSPLVCADPYGGQLVLSTTSDPKSFNPIIAKETSTTAITGKIFEGLTRTNGITLEVEPNLAERWEVKDNGLEWVFYLRKDVFWSDQTPFTADDVVFTFNDLIFNDEIPSSARDIFTIEGKIFLVEKIDDFTVKFTLPVKFAPFLRAMGQSILPRHILQESVQKGTFNFTWGIDSEPETIVGTGPFMLEEYSPGERIVLKRNPRYWRKSQQGEPLPFIEKILYLIVQNQDTVLLKFLEGEIDLCSVRGMDYPLLKPREQKNDFTIFDAGPAFGSSFVVFNMNTGVNPKTSQTYIDQTKLNWFSNLEFRRAVAYAIDKKRIIEILMNGLGYPQDGAMSPSAGYFYNSKVKKYPYDLKKARTLLTKAGFFDRNGDGIIEDREGNPIQFNLYTNSGSNERIQIAAIIRHDLENLGMKVNFLALEFNILVQKLSSTYDWDAVIIGLTGGIEPHFGKNVWSSNGQLHMWYPRQPKPQTPWEERIDEIYAAGVQELDRAKRKKYYDEWQMIVSRELPMIYTVLEASIYAVRNKFGNLHPTSYGGILHNIEEITIHQQYR